MSPGALIAAASAAPVVTPGSGDDPAHGQPLQHAPHSPWLWVLLGIVLLTVALSAVLARSRRRRARDQRQHPTSAAGDTGPDTSPVVRAATPRNNSGRNAGDNGSPDDPSPGMPGASSGSWPTEPPRSPDGPGTSL